MRDGRGEDWKTACLFDLIIVDVLSCTSPAGGGGGKRGGRDGDARGEDDKRQADQVRPLRVDSPQLTVDWIYASKPGDSR